VAVTPSRGPWIAAPWIVPGVRARQNAASTGFETRKPWS
jgi:hypothetical protein